MNNTQPTLFGSLILESSMRTVHALPLPQLDGLEPLEGVHLENRPNGRWCEVSNYEQAEVLMPTRQKNLLIRSSNPDALPFLKTRLSTLDSDFLNKRQMYKLGRLLEEVPLSVDLFAATVNITSSENVTSSNGGFYLLSSGVPIHVYVVYDLRDKSIRLTWSSFDLKPVLRAADLTRYAFYEMPQVLDNPLFLPTQIICSRWYQFGRFFKKQKEYPLIACNALETLLYKDPKE